MPSKLTASDKAAVAKVIRHTKLVEASRKMARIVRHTDPPADVIAERDALEVDVADWMRHHGGEAFAEPFGPDHDTVLAKIAEAVTSGGTFALAMPRGHGKTTILKWVTLYVLLTGRRKYVMTIAATTELAQAIVDFCRQQLTESDSLHEHYPHVTTYARATEGKAIKARFQLRADGKSSGIKWSKTKLVFPEVVSPTDGTDYPSNGAILEGRGLTGAIRGKWEDTKTGKVHRPDFVLLDDPQDRSSAESPSQCDMRERIITGDVLGLAGPRKRIAAVMPCTIIRKGDLADRFLDRKLHPEWQGETCSLVKTWPTAQDTLWAEYATIYRDATSDGRGFGDATAFYKAHRADMDAGAEVSWDSRVRDGEISALQTAENLLLESGPQFWAEYQNAPLSITGGEYQLTPAEVLTHVVAIPRLHVPDQTTVLVGSCDINRIGLHWCVAGYDQQMTGHAAAYGRWPARGELWAKNAHELERKQAIFKGLRELFAQLAVAQFMRAGKPMRLGLMLIDRGYEPDVVHKFASAAVLPFRVMPSRGYAAHKYWPRKASLVGKPLEGCHVTQSDNGNFVAFNADLWRETSQRAFLADPGAPGGFTIFDAPPGAHADFAAHVTAEKIVNKYQTDAGPRWEWAHQPGSNWDYGDALTGCYVAAATQGLSASGEGAVVRPRRSRGVRHIAV